METLVHKTSGGGTTNPHVQYSSMSNTNAPLSIPANPVQQVVLPQPAPITKAAKPVRDSAQFVSEKKNNENLTFFSN